MADEILSTYRHRACGTEVSDAVARGLHVLTPDGKPPMIVPSVQSRDHAYCPVCRQWRSYSEFEWRGVTAPGRGL